MGFFSSFTGGAQRRDMKNAYRDSNAMVDAGYNAAQGNLTSGFNRANAGYDQGRADIASGYGNALSQLGQGVNQGVAEYRPYADSGTGANSLYANALGINGQVAQQDFMRNYETGDPFRASNANFANNAIMQQMNARGMSGGGVAAAAVAQESLRRGSQDYENYLSRLNGVADRGMQAAGNIAGLYADQGKTAANYGYQQGSDLANISGRRADTGWNYGAAQAGLNTDQAQLKAGNRINLGNSLANSRSIGINNLMNVAGVALKASGIGGYKG